MSLGGVFGGSVGVRSTSPRWHVWREISRSDTEPYGGVETFSDSALASPRSESSTLRFPAERAEAPQCGEFDGPADSHCKVSAKASGIGRG